MNEGDWPAIAVMGAGAVGCYFGGMLARAGAPVTLIGRSPHVEAMTRDGLLVETSRFRERARVSASTDAVAVRHANIVLFCVKTLDTEKAAQVLAPHLASSAIVVSLQNGVDNVERIRAATGMEALAAVVYVGAEMAGAGHVKHTARGDLVIGEFGRRAPSEDVRHRLEQVAGLFVRAKVPCRVSDDVEGELWMKLIINCAYNALSALSRSRYGKIAANPFTREILRQVVEETAAVARAAGVVLPDANPVETTWKLADSMPGTMSSTAQDILRGKRTEIDSLNGYVARRGASLGVAAPVNQTLHALVKLVEELAADGAG